MNDILRDKLLHITTQLADAMTRVRELEQEKSGVWSRMADGMAQNLELRTLLISSGTWASYLGFTFLTRT